MLRAAADCEIVPAITEQQLLNAFTGPRGGRVARQGQGQCTQCAA